MKKFSLFLTILLVAACSTNPITGKKPLILVSNADIFPMAFQQYNQILQEEKVVSTTAQAKQVKTVGNNIKRAVERSLAQQGKSDFTRDYKWEFNLIESDAVNAWCMPGGKVAFYTGIMPIAANDNGVAVVMGHEITHALAEHSAQRMSQGIIAQGLQVAGNVALSDSKYRNVFNSLYPVGAQVGILAYSRSAELEADAIGLRLMAMAGYDPREAPKFWKRMEQATAGSSRPPEFLSTHPDPGRRIAQLEAKIPEVLPLYYQATGKTQ